LGGGTEEKKNKTVFDVAEGAAATKQEGTTQCARRERTLQPAENQHQRGIKGRKVPEIPVVASDPRRLPKKKRGKRAKNHTKKRGLTHKTCGPDEKGV